VNFSQENNENSNNKNNINFSTDYKILNDFQMNKKPNNIRKIKKFIISKSNTGDSWIVIYKYKQLSFLLNYDFILLDVYNIYYISIFLWIIYFQILNLII